MRRNSRGRAHSLDQHSLSSTWSIVDGGEPASDRSVKIPSGVRLSPSCLCIKLPFSHTVGGQRPITERRPIGVPSREVARMRLLIAAITNPCGHALRVPIAIHLVLASHFVEFAIGIGNLPHRIAFSRSRNARSGRGWLPSFRCQGAGTLFVPARHPCWTIIADDASMADNVLLLLLVI